MFEADSSLHWQAVQGYVPHQPPMLMLDAIAMLPDGRVAGKTVAQPEWPCMASQPALLPVEACAELIAQCYAGAAGIADAQKADQPENAAARRGFLVGMRDFVFYPAPVECGAKLFILLELETAVGDFVLVDGSVQVNQHCLAKGQVKIYLPPAEAL